MSTNRIFPTLKNQEYINNPNEFDTYFAGYSYVNPDILYLVFIFVKVNKIIMRDDGKLYRDEDIFIPSADEDEEESREPFMSLVSDFAKKSGGFPSETEKNKNEESRQKKFIKLYQEFVRYLFLVVKIVNHKG